MTEEAKQETNLQRVERMREERRTALAAQRDEQRAIDLEALLNLEIEQGETNVAHVDVPFMPGSVTLAAVITPKAPLFKRYQDRIKNNPKDTSGPAEEIGEASVRYPQGDALARLFGERPGLKVELGVVALTLTTGRIADEGKG